MAPPSTYSPIYPDLKGKVALITGIGQVPQAKDSEIWGNGASTARFLARNGVKIVGCDLNIQDAERTKSRVLEETPDADIFVLTANATKSDQVERLVQTAVDRHGRIDILINNVGTSKPGGPVEMSEDDWQWQLDVNLGSAFLVCKHVFPIMERQGSGGAVTVTGSISAFGHLGKMHIGYSTTKAALINFAKCTAVQYATKGIRINCVIPGLMHTPMLARLASEYNQGDYQGLLDKRGNGVPMGRQGTSNDVANANLFLVSDAASYITGTSLVVDGGVTAEVCNYG